MINLAIVGTSRLIVCSENLGKNDLRSMKMHKRETNIKVGRNIRINYTNVLLYLPKTEAKTIAHFAYIPDI